MAAEEPGVERGNGVLTTQLAPDAIVAALSLDFADTLSARDVEHAVSAIERKVRAAHPEVVSLFVKPQTGESFRDAQRRRYGAPAGEELATRDSSDADRSRPVRSSDSGGGSV